MKKILLSTLTLLCISCDKTSVNNTVENIHYTKRNQAILNNNNNTNEPSYTLRQYLLDNGYDTNRNGVLDTNEVTGIIVLNAANKDITSLDGIDNLISLNEANFSGNKIRTATIRVTTLANLNLSNNRLNQLDISGATRLVNKLNITGNPDLLCVKASNNQRNLLTLSSNFAKDSQTTISENCN